MQQVIVKSRKAKRKEFMGISFDVLAIGEHMMVTKMCYEAGDTVPPHKHPNEQSGYVVSGQYKVKFGDEEGVLGAGDSYVIPMNQVHTIEVLGSGDVIDVFSPPREDYRP